MSARTPIGGIWAAAITPVDADLQPDAAKAVPYYRDLLAGGCDGVNLLGTTGEAMSFSAEQRLRFMEAVAAGGVPVERTMAGTGAASLADAVRLTRRAIDLGFAAALVMPPFFFRAVPDEGIVAFYDQLLARADVPPGSMLLYNFPRMSGITLHADLVEALVARSAGRIFGIKDSSNDPLLQSAIHARLPEFRIFPGSESGLLAAKARGAAGCISGSVALWAPLAKEVFESGDPVKAAELDERRAALNGAPLVGAVRRLTAKLRNDPAWERAMPPNVCG